MKRWEEKRRLKAHKKKLRGMKSKINNGNVKKSMSAKRSKMKSFVNQTNNMDTSDVLSTSSIDNNSITGNRSQISEYYEHEKQDLQSIPLFRLLKLYNLQQYAKQLITRGFGYKIEKLCRLTRTELQELMIHIKIMPGHKIIPDIMIDPNPKRMKKSTKKSKSNKSNYNSYKQFYKPKTAVRPTSGKKKKSGKRNKTAQKKRMSHKLRKIGCDFFDAKDKNIYNQFQDTMDDLLFKYQQNPQQYQQQQQKTEKMQTKPHGFYNQKKGKGQRHQPSFKRKSQPIQDKSTGKSTPSSHYQLKQTHNKSLSMYQVQQDKARKKSRTKQRSVTHVQSVPQIQNEVELVPEKYGKDSDTYSQKQKKNEYNDSDLMQQEIHDLVSMLNKDPDARISLDLLKCLSPEVRSQLLNSNLINNISEIKTNRRPSQKIDSFIVEDKEEEDDQEQEEKQVLIQTENEELRKSVIQSVEKIQYLKKKITSTLNKNVTDKPKLQITEAKSLFASYDGSKMTSTIVNIDIEEICYCLACAFQKHIMYFQKSYEEGLIEEYSTNYGQKVKKIPNPQLTNKNKQLLVLDKPPKEIEEISEKDQAEEFKFNNVSDMDKSNDKSSTRYDAKFMEDDDMNYDPEMVNPTNVTHNSDQKQEMLIQDEHNQDSQVNYLEPQDQNRMNQPELIEGQFQDEEWIQNQMMKQNAPQHQLSKISEKTVDYSRQHEEIKRDINPEFEKSRIELETILRESLMGVFKPSTKRSMMQSSLEDSQKENMNFLLHSQGGRDSVQIDFSYASQYEEDLNDIVQDPLKRYQAKQIFDECFNDTIPPHLMTRALMELPTKQMILNFCKNILLTAQMEKEIPILSLVYVERLIINSGFYVTPVNWRKIAFGSLMVASKIWDDESFENDSFHKAFRLYTPTEINNMERRLLDFIDYKLFIKASEYAKYYFILRSFAQKNKKSFPLKELDLDRILFLQQNQNKAQQKLREIYSEPLNKTYEF